MFKRHNYLDVRFVAVNDKLKIEDPHYFSNLFKKQHGVSPRQYRSDAQPQGRSVLRESDGK